MNTKATLMLLAATLAPLPLYAQEAPAPAPQTVQAPSAAAQRAAVLAPLAMVPSDAEAAAIFQIPEGLVPFLKSVTLGASKGSGEAVNQYYSILCSILGEFVLENGAKSWADIAPGNIGEIILDVAKTHKGVLAGQAKAAGAKIHLAPAYAILTPVAGQEEAFWGEVNDDIAKMKASAEEEEGAEFIQTGSFCGLKLTITPHTDGVDTEVVTALGESLSGRTLYVLIGAHKGQAVYMICSDPAEIHFANSPETSILNTEPWAAVDANLADNIILAASVDPAIHNGVYASYSSFAPVVEAAAGVFGKMADLDNANANTYKAAAAGVNSLIEQLGASIPTVKEPSFVQIWENAGSFHFELKGDSMGNVYETARLTQAIKGADPDTILYIEGTPLHIGQTIDCAAVANAAVAVVNGVFTTLQPEGQAQVQEAAQTAAVFAPELMKLGAAVESIGLGMGGTAAVIVDGKGSAPTWVFDGKKSSFPRIALCSGVTDRSKLSAGWDGIMEAAGGILTKAGQDVSMLAMLPILPATVGDATSYTVAFPGIFTADVCPNVTVSDKAIAFGTSSSLDQEVVTQATGTIEFAGIKFVLRGAPLGKLITDMGAAAEDEDLIGVGTAIESMLESISGSSTIKDGVHTLRIDVNTNVK